MLFSLCLDHPFSIFVTKDNLFEYVGKEKPVVLHFYSDSCGHCMEMTPAWNELTRMYHNVDGIDFAVVSCDHWKSICSALEGSSTPTIQFIPPHERKGFPYGGDYNVKQLTRWVKDNSGLMPFSAPGYPVYAKKNEIEELRIQDWILVVADEPRKSFYNQTAIRSIENIRDDITIRSISPSQEPGYVQSICNNRPHCIVLMNDKNIYEYKGDSTQQAILDFLDFHYPQSDL